MLAHASGEWIASDWPMCPLTDVAAPHRMGAALTYARRYALFTLVGIAGEDDLDAPDLASKTSGSAGGPSEGRQTPLRGFGNSGPPLGRKPGNGRLESPPMRRTAILRTELSASLRERLESQIVTLGSHDDAADWARGALAAKNSLTAVDAKAVEDAFEQKLSQLPSPELDEGSPKPGLHERATPTDPANRGKKRQRVRSAGVDKSVLAFPAPKRHRNKEHLRYVAQQPCLVCGRKPSDPHHLRFTQPRALGNKVSDEFTVPLCRMHHRAAHKAGDELTWWQIAGVDPLPVAQKLWDDTRSQPIGM